MKPFTQSLAAALAAVLLVVAIPACSTGGGRSPSKHGTEYGDLPRAPAPGETKKLVQGHHDRERVQFQAAERINVIGAGVGGQVESDLREQTGIIVQANKDASAADIEAHLAAFTVATKALQSRITTLEGDNAKLVEENRRLRDAEAKAQVGKLRGWGFWACGAGAVLTYLGIAYMPPLRLLGAGTLGVGILLLAAAQLWAWVSAQWWFMPATAIVCVVIVWLLARVVIDGLKHKTLAADAKSAAEQAAETLKVIVATTEKAKKDLGKSAPISALLDLLDRKMNDPHKAVVEDIVRETKPV